jgi:hypothetical protein
LRRARIITGDKIAGATERAVRFRAERKLGGRAEALAPPIDEILLIELCGLS